MINVGIIGCGFVGGALKDWLEHNNPECKLFISDPPKGYNDDLSGIDIAFLQIHVPTEDDGTQDLTLMKQLITNLPDVPVFVRTTILPGTSDRLSKETGHQVCYMPEFLTERTFIEDFRKQTMVFTGAHELLTKIFVGKKFTVMTPLEAELTKYMHNVFGAYKVLLQRMPRVLRADGCRLAQGAYRCVAVRLYQRHPHLRPRSRWQVRLWWQVLPQRCQCLCQDDRGHTPGHPAGAPPRVECSFPEGEKLA